MCGDACSPSAHTPGLGPLLLEKVIEGRSENGYTSFHPERREWTNTIMEARPPVFSLREDSERIRMGARLLGAGICSLLATLWTLHWYLQCPWKQFIKSLHPSWTQMGMISSPLPLSSSTSCRLAFSTLWWHSRQSHGSPNPVVLHKQFPSVLKPPFQRLYFVSNLKQNLNSISDSKVLLFPLSSSLPWTVHPFSTQVLLGPCCGCLSWILFPPSPCSIGPFNPAA